MTKFSEKICRRDDHVLCLNYADGIMGTCVFQNLLNCTFRYSYSIQLFSILFRSPTLLT